MIDWQSFTLVSAFTDRMIIGFATALLLLIAGRIAGISGIVGGWIRITLRRFRLAGCLCQRITACLVAVALAGRITPGSY